MKSSLRGLQTIDPFIDGILREVKKQYPPKKLRVFHEIGSLEEELETEAMLDQIRDDEERGQS